MASREDPDPYVVLGVRRQASPEEIVRAYRRAARLTHPDGGRSGAGSERFRAVSDAYEVCCVTRGVVPATTGSIRYPDRRRGGRRAMQGRARSTSCSARDLRRRPAVAGRRSRTTTTCGSGAP